MRIVQVIAGAGHADTLRGLAEHQGAVDVWISATGEDGRLSAYLLVPPSRRQAVLDALQGAVGASPDCRILVLPTDAVMPLPKAVEERESQHAATASREELYNQIEKGARLDSSYLVLVVLSTIVATIGLAEDNVSVVVGAMVIAPLLGPHIALAFATSLGDTAMLWRALRTSAAGLGLALALAMAYALIWPVSLASHEIQARTVVGLDSVALALASGAAAVLSFTTGLPTTLVGVMVAVALLPPTATLGMLLGSARFDLAQAAALLLAVNVVSVILAAKLVFMVKGVRPRTWIERRKAEQSTRAYVSLWVVLLLLLVVAIVARRAVQG
jgi:uncharacterized hydrophobic protein (TIGR00341 family)